jgi:hypothetical protein
MKEVQVFEEMYRADISLIVGGTIPELQSLIESRHDDAPQLDDDTDGYQFECRSKGGQNERFYIYIEKMDPYLLYHEIMHLVFSIMKHRGITYSSGSEEAFAYLGGRIFELLKIKI